MIFLGEYECVILVLLSLQEKQISDSTDTSTGAKMLYNCE